MMAGSTTYLAERQIEDFRTAGYLILRSVFQPDEVAALAAEAESLFARADLIDTNNIRCRWQDHVTTRECLFDCFDPVIDLGPICRLFATDPRIMGPLTAIYDDHACLLKDKLIFKRPGAMGYALHQDYISWPEFPESFVTVILAIDPTDASNGATQVFPGLHRQGYLSERDGEYHELNARAVAEADRVVLNLGPGDLAFFSGFMPHCSEPNHSDRWRRQLYLSYNAHRDGGQQRDAHYRQFHAWLKEKYAQHGRRDVYFR